MLSSHPPPPRQAEVLLFRATLDDETDRGCALMAAAYLDSQLEELLRKTFVDDLKVIKRIFNASGQPTSTRPKVEHARAKVEYRRLNSAPRLR